MKALDSGADVVEIAKGFVNSAGVRVAYGANASNEMFRQALYNNVLHREPDDAGWLLGECPDRRHPRAALVGFSDSAENIEVMSHIIPVGVPTRPGWRNPGYRSPAG
jgi:hypothetical protein